MVQIKNNSAFVGALYNEFMGIDQKLIEQQVLRFYAKFNGIMNGMFQQTFTHQLDFSPTALKGFATINLEQMAWFGIDLPVWLSSKETPQYRLMIIAMDPLRSEDLTGKTSPGGLTLNTPFTIHDRSVKNNYNQQITDLAKRYDIYITDAFKLFFRDARNYKAVSNQMPDFRKNLVVHYGMLQKELNFFNPDFVLCLGKDAGMAVAALGEFEFKPIATTSLDYQKHHYRLFEKTVFCVPHASGAARGHAAAFLRSHNSSYRSSSYLSDVVSLIEHQFDR